MQSVRSKPAARVRRASKRVRVVGAVDSVLRVPTEHEEQRNLVRWFRQTFGLVTRGGVRIFAIPNGSQRSRTTGAKLKAEGEYEIFRKRQDSEYISDFDREIKRLEGNQKGSRGTRGKKA